MRVQRASSLGAWIAPPPPDAPRVFGLDGEERLRRGLVRAGLDPARIRSGHEPLPDADRILLVRSDQAFDPRLLQALPAHPDTALVTQGADPEAHPELLAIHVAADRARAARSALEGGSGFEGSGLRLCRPEELVSAYSAALRKSEPARVWPARNRREARRAEEALFRAAYKGVTDLVTAWVWPRPALCATRALANARIPPNAVTAVSIALVALATALFAAGLHGAGLAAAWLMTFLDTVDGKLARVTLRGSRLGHVLDHGLDLIHPPFWYLAFGFSLAGTSASELGDWRVLATWWTVLGYLLDRGVEGLALWTLGFEIHSWRRLDSRFRSIAARRNPNLLLLTAATLAGRPDLGIGAVAVWTAFSLLFHAVRVGAALTLRRRGALGVWQETQASWQSTPTRPGHPEAAQ